LQRVLNDLHALGYIERRFSDFRGRHPEEWRINVRAFPYLISLSEDELVSLFTLISFVPKKYRELEPIRPIRDALNRLVVNLNDEKLKIAEESFDYLPIPVERFASLPNGTMKLLFEGIIEKRGVLINYAGKLIEVLPIKLFQYNGILYLSAVLKETGEYRTLLLWKLKALTLTKSTISNYLRCKYKKVFFDFEREPFILKVYLPENYSRDISPGCEVLFYPTQFYSEVEREKEATKVLLVAQPSYRFASWILLDEILEISPPDEDDIKLAKERNIKRDFPDISLSLEVNKKRFKKFYSYVEKFINRRLKLIK